MMHAVDQVLQGIRKYLGICINLERTFSASHWILRYFTYHQADLEEVRSYTHEDMDFSEEVKVEGGHPVVVCDTREEIHENKLTVPFSSVSRFLPCSSLCFSSALHYNNRGRPATRNS